MGKVLHAIRLVGDAIDSMALGGLAPIRVPLKKVISYLKKEKIIRK